MTLLLLLVPRFIWHSEMRRLLQARFRPKPLKHQPSLWLHAVSLGEAQILSTLLRGLLDTETWVTLPKVLLTASTRSGFETLEKHFPGAVVRYMPVDAMPALKRLFRHVHVTDLLVAETELWPALFEFVHANGKRILLFNARFGPKTRTRAGNPLMKRCLERVNVFLVRSEDEKRFLLHQGLEPGRIHVTGNIKFDYCPPPVPEDQLGGWLAAGPLVVFASISDDEMEVLAPCATYLLKQFCNLRLLWVPRHFDRLDEHLASLNLFQASLRSKGIPHGTRCLVLDTVGELSGTYEFARCSVIGGSFNQRGGQNFLESLAVGTPAIVGPNMVNFQQELDLAKRKGSVIQVKGSEGLKRELVRLIREPEERELMGQRALEFMRANRGALEKSVNHVRTFLQQADHGS